ncbi:hypothetical protein WG922_21835 [Ramlibacter sp. AN1015]|uniref:hypothetical protein n=1 Tax=Ramlibacter sp. AN1015 TaxID=3133428 RepID=UPI0030BBB46A
MDLQLEPWELSSGTWFRDRTSETWRLAVASDGTVVDPRLSSHDVARLIGASRECDSGQWFPPEFGYSQQSGKRLSMLMPKLDSPWAPPFGASELGHARPRGRGLRQTLLPLTLACTQEERSISQPERTLPPLPPGQYRFVVSKFGISSPTLVAAEPRRGRLFALLPESRNWLALQRWSGAAWGQKLLNPRGWRMELVQNRGPAVAYCPSACGVASVSPNAVGAGYAVEHVGDGPALGGPVARGHEVWAPLLAAPDLVQLIGVPVAATGTIVLPTQSPVPQRGFEAPVFDDSQANWPCDEGQLVLRLEDNDRRCEWIKWPDGRSPLFALGCPYLAATGTFWQLCRRTADSGFEYVEMASSTPAIVPIHSLRLSTGRACYHAALRIDGDPWQAGPGVDHRSPELVAPLLESVHDGAVIGLRMNAPEGAMALLQSHAPCHAILQWEVPGRPAVPFGSLHVRRPWLALLFVYDNHLWVHHPELAQVVGWKLTL